MALTVAALGNIQNTANVATFNTVTHGTGNLTPGAAGRAVFAIVAPAEGSGTVPTPTLKNHSALPFQFLGTGTGTHPITGGTELLGFWGCLATGTTADSIDIDFDGNAQGGCCASFVEVSGFDTPPTTIGEAVRQLVTATVASGTSAPVTLAAFGSAANIYLYGVHLRTGAALDIAPEASAAEIHDLGYATPARSLFTSWKVNDASPTATWAGAIDGLAAAIEVNSTGVVAGSASHVVRQQVYNETNGNLITFAPAVAPTVGRTLVVCVTVEHGSAPTYTAGNGYVLMTDPAVSTMDYPINNNAFDRQRWYSKVATGTDTFTLSVTAGVGGWNLAYWELDGEYEVASVLSTYSGATSTRTQDPAAIADPTSADIAYLVGWSAVHFETAADPVDFSGFATHALIDRGDAASTGGTKAQTSAADKSVSNGYVLNQDVVLSANAMTGVRNTAVAMVPVAVGGVFPDVVVGGVKKAVVAESVIVGGVKKAVVNQWVIVGGAKKPLV